MNAWKPGPCGAGERPQTAQGPWRWLIGRWALGPRLRPCTMGGLAAFGPAGGCCPRHGARGRPSCPCHHGGCRPGGGRGRGGGAFGGERAGCRPRCNGLLDVGIGTCTGPWLLPSPRRGRVESPGPEVLAVGDLALEVSEGVPGWMHKPDLDVSRHAAYTRLQSWTLKPVAFR